MTFPADAAAALAVLKTALATAGTLQGAPKTASYPVILAAASAVAVMQADVAAIEPALNSGSPDGSDPTVLAAWLLAAQANSANQANLQFASAYTARIILNLTAAQSQ